MLLLSGHSHAQRHVFHGADSGWHGAAPLHEFNVGAACGSFWSGMKDAQGIPDSTMADGTPNGFATLVVAHEGTSQPDVSAEWATSDPKPGEPVVLRLSCAGAASPRRRSA